MIVFRDSLLDAQLLRTIAHGEFGGAEIGECLATARKIRAGDHASWLAAWMQLADRTFAAAEASERGGHRVSARHAYLRAANYYRNAYIFHLETPVPAVALDAYRRHRVAFGKAAALLDRAVTALAIPFGDTTLHGYFCSAGDGARPVVVCVGGYDSTAEEGYFFNAAAAVERGYHCVVFDGPGQGDALFEHGLTFRPDWEIVIAAVLDVVAARADVDATRIAVIGESFGGYLAPRAAAIDPRIAACALDPAQLGLFRAALARVPVPAGLKAQLPAGPGWLVAILRRLLARVARKPTAGFALRRGMLTHGKSTAWDYFADTARFAAPDVAAIRCPVLVCDAADDDIAGYAREFFELLACDKTYVRFTAADGAGDHCIMGNRGMFHERVFDWLDTKLAAHADATTALAMQPLAS